MAYPVTLNGRTYTLADFEGTNYVEGLPDAFEDFVTHAGDIYNSTSTTSNSIGTGSKTFTVESAKPYQAGTPLRIADAAAPSTNFMDCIVTSYSGTTLVVDSVGYAGSGTFTSWNVNIGGAASVAGTVAIAQGGTGATTAAAARTNLDVYSKADADSRFLNVSGEASDVTMTGNVTIGDASSDTLTINANVSGDVAFDTDTFYVDATNDRVGIGTSSPSHDLEVSGSSPTIKIQDTSTVAQDVGGRVNLSGYYTGTTENTYAQILGAKENATDANRRGYFSIKTRSLSAGLIERFRVTSDGKVGIGTDSPDEFLHIRSASPAIILDDSNNDGKARIDGDDGSLLLNADTANALGSTRIAFLVDGSEVSRIHANGSFSIGTTSSGYGDFSILRSGTNNTKLALANNGNGGGTVSWSLDHDYSNYNFKISHNAAVGGQNLIFGTKTSGGESARFDSSGNLLVGRTTTINGNTNTTSGSQIASNGLIQTAVSNDTAIALQRLSSDGDIIQFRKDTTTMGAIGTSGNNLAIHGAGTGDDATGLMFVNSGSTQRIVPCQENFTLNNGIINLGHSSNRFKDLYLSGGVYLGGTGSANHLDDYEEGTWTPTLFAGGTQATLEHQGGGDTQGVYTKIGRQVTIHAEVDVNSLNGGTGSIIVKNLPFGVADLLYPTGIEASGSVSYYNVATALSSISCYVASTNEIFFEVTTSGTQASSVTMTDSHLGTGEFRLTITYFTNA